MSRLNLPHLVIQSVLSFELVVCSVSSQFSKLLVSRRHVRSKEPPRPVGPRPGGGARWREGASVRPSPFFNSSVQHACFRSINVMSGNAIYRRLHCVVFSPVHPKAVRAKGPAQTLDSPYSKRRSFRSGPVVHAAISSNIWHNTSDLSLCQYAEEITFFHVALIWRFTCDSGLRRMGGIRLHWLKDTKFAPVPITQSRRRMHGKVPIPPDGPDPVSDKVWSGQHGSATGPQTLSGRVRSV